MPARSATPDQVQPDRLALGEASRMLGVDPDTLRRWADEGRVPAFTTPGGHRRFERRTLERLVDDRRTGPGGMLAGLGATQDRLSAAYRRRYEHPAAGAPEARASIPDADRQAFRDSGRLLVDALVRRLDEAGHDHHAAEHDAVAIAATMGDRLARRGVPMPDAVTMFVSARQPFLAELRTMARRRGVDGARVNRIYDIATGLLDRLLLAFIDAHATAARAATQPAAADRARPA